MLVENYKVRLMVQFWQEFFIADMLDMTVRGKTVRAYTDRINKRKKYAQMELPHQEENSMIHVSYP